jgi:hypothetical protein
VGLGGLEPPASPLSGVRSNQLSYRPLTLTSQLHGASRDRTDHPLRARQVLYRMSYGPEHYSLKHSIHRADTYLFKEVIQPQVPLRLPCYDFTPVMNHTVASGLFR